MELVKIIEKLNKKSGNILISIDGMCGSGKTTLANSLREHFSFNLFHIDDFYLPMKQRKVGWEKEGGNNIDFSRFLNEVIIPTKAGESVVYRPYSCQEQKMNEAIPMKNTRLSIVEGSYSQHPLLAEYYDLKIFLYCTEEVQKDRLINRNKEKYINYVNTWIPMENQYFKQYNIKEQSDVQIDNSLHFLRRK